MIRVSALTGDEKVSHPSGGIVLSVQCDTL